MSYSLSLQQLIRSLEKQMGDAGFLPGHPIKADTTVTVPAGTLADLLQEADDVNGRLLRIEEEQVNINNLYNELAQWLRYRDVMPSRSLQDDDTRRIANLIEESEMDRFMVSQRKPNGQGLIC